MNINTEPLLTSTRSQVKAIQSLTTFGYSGTNRFAQFNVYAGLAALDNTTHHFSSLARSKGLEELIELQIRSVLPAAESAKAYVRQIFAFAAATSREFAHVIERQVSQIQDKACDDLYAGLTNAGENGNLAAGLLKDTLALTREAALTSQASITRAVDGALNIPDFKSDEGVTDVVAKPPKRER
jgi:phasin family protein